MRSGFSFVGATIAGGFFVLLPVVLISLVLVETVQAVVTPCSWSVGR